MILPFARRTPTLESVRAQATNGLSTWLFELVDRIPGLIPEPAEPAVEERVVAARLRRFVHDAVTRDPATRAPLPGVQFFLIELALGCVDWTELAAHPRLRGLDWEITHLKGYAQVGPAADVRDENLVAATTYANTEMMFFDRLVTGDRDIIVRTSAEVFGGTRVAKTITM